MWDSGIHDLMALPWRCPSIHSRFGSCGTGSGRRESTPKSSTDSSNTAHQMTTRTAHCGKARQYSSVLPATTCARVARIGSSHHLVLGLLCLATANILGSKRAAILLLCSGCVSETDQTLGFSCQALVYVGQAWLLVVPHVHFALWSPFGRSSGQSNEESAARRGMRAVQSLHQSGSRSVGMLPIRLSGCFKL
jgi:hypothetical protein